MKKIVVISGSPRKKGNTISIVNIFEQNMKKNDPDISFEYIYLIDKDLRYCRGCSICLKEGGHTCPLKDDGPEILKTMHSADGLVFASPGYSAMVSGLFKNFLDRFMYLDHIPEFIGVPVSIICTSGGDGVNGAPNFTANNAITWWGCTIVNKIGIGHAFYVINKKYRKKTDKMLQMAAAKMCNEVQNKALKRPTLRQYLYFMFNKVELQISSTVMPFRYKVWKDNGWMKQDYYYQTSINFLYKIISFFLFSFMKISYRLLLGKNGDAALADWARNN